MKCHIFSYRYGQEILQHGNFAHAWKEITGILGNAPVFIWPKKSPNNKKLDIVQQLMNAYFDRVFVIENGWQYHPLATKIKDSKLTADYRKQFVGANGATLEIQVEIQFGNMARFYSDVFKFQAAYSERAIQIGMSVVPCRSMAVRIDSNVAHFERAKRELPSAELSITLPIVLVGLEIDETTKIIDASMSKFKNVGDLTSKGKGDNLRRMVHAVVTNADISKVSSKSDTGPDMPEAPAAADSEDED